MVGRKGCASTTGSAVRACSGLEVWSCLLFFGRFLGADVARARELYADDVQASEEESASEEEDDWMPVPVAEGGEIRDEEEDFGQMLDEQLATDRRLLVLAYLELALAQRVYFDGDGAMVSLRKACHYEKIGFRLTGEMGGAD